MKGYKAFEKGMICNPTGENPFQYAENTVFEQDNEAEIHNSGFHFCKNPLDVLECYPLIDKEGNMSEFAEVEALGKIKTDDNKSYCTKKLKIGAKLSFADLIQSSFDFGLEKTSNNLNVSDNYARINSNKRYSRISASGMFAQICSNCYSTQINSSGGCARIISNSSTVRISSSGESAKIGLGGSHARVSTSGDNVQIGASSSGDRISSCGDNAQIGLSDNYNRISLSGDKAQLSTSGKSAQINSSGEFVLINSSSELSKINSSGHDARIISSGENSVICCVGKDSKVKAKKGSWITLAEWSFNKEKDDYIPVCVKTEFVDGERIKEDTFYILKNGEFVEVE